MTVHFAKAPFMYSVLYPVLEREQADLFLIRHIFQNAHGIHGVDDTLADLAAFLQILLRCEKMLVPGTYNFLCHSIP